MYDCEGSTAEVAKPTPHGHGQPREAEKPAAPWSYGGKNPIRTDVDLQEANVDCCGDHPATTSGPVSTPWPLNLSVIPGRRTPHPLHAFW
jgi:hypothetical protein